MLSLLLMLASADAKEPWPDIDEPLRTGTSAPNDAAVVIGNEAYTDIAAVPYAAADADAFRAFLLYTRGVAPERLQVLDDATPRQMEKAVERAAGEVGPGGVLWVYYAGHGAAHPVSGERVLLGKGATLDPDPDLFEEGVVSLDALKDIAASSGGEVLFVVDACYSGAGRGGEALGDGRFAVPPDYTAEARVTEWAATQPDQVASPLHEVGHGAFTYFAVGALRGWADGEQGDADGQVSLTEAQTYVSTALRSVGQRDQTPVVVGEDALVLMQSAELEPPPDLRGLLDPAGDSGARGGLRIAAWVLDAALVGAGAGLVWYGSREEASLQSTLASGLSPDGGVDAAQRSINGVYLGGYAALAGGAALGTGLALRPAPTAAPSLGLMWSGRW